MRLVTTLLPTLLLLHCGQSYDDQERDCNQFESFNFSDVKGIFTFSAQATCTKFSKIFQFNPDPNATRGRLLTLLALSGERHYTRQIMFETYEFNTHENGSIKQIFERTPGQSVKSKQWFAPTTGILVNFTQSGNDSPLQQDFLSISLDRKSSFSASLAETAMGHHCPYPFINLQPDVPVVIEETVLVYSCNVLLTAPEGHVVRIDHINDTDVSHDTVIKLFEGSEFLMSFDTFPVVDTMTGSDSVRMTIHQKTDHSHQIVIQVSAVKLDCTCGPSELVFNASLTSLFFTSPDYPNEHCLMVSCQTTFILPVELRKSYKMQLSEFDSLTYGIIEIDDGPNGIKSRNQNMKPSFAFESPVVTLNYTPTVQRFGDAFNLEMKLVERQDGCACPRQTNIATTFYVEIPTHCRSVDCLYLLPKIDDNTVTFKYERDEIQDYIGHRSRWDSTDSISYYVKQSGKWAFKSKGQLLVRFHRDDPTLKPTIFNFTYTTSGVHLSFSERCGCVNKTILLESSEVMEFASPDWPSHYCPDLFCVTTFVAPAHHHLEVMLDSMSIDPHGDLLAFYEGTNISEMPIRDFTGAELIGSVPIFSSSTIMTSLFISDGEVSYDGYNGTITAVMDKSWSDHLKHHISGWWWLLVVLVLLSVVGMVLVVRNRRGGIGQITIFNCCTQRPFRHSESFTVLSPMHFRNILQWKRG